MDDTAWFGPEDAGALQDFFAIYESHIDVIDVVTASAQLDGSLERVAHAMAPSWPTRVVAERRAVLRRAIAGDWAPYDAALRVEATEQADDGRVAWQTVTRSIARRLTPHVVAAYEHSPRRLGEALRVMHEFLDRVQATLGAAYFERRDALLRSAELRYRRLADSGVVGIIVSEPSGAILEANDAFLATVGHSRASLEAGQLDWRAMSAPEFSASNASAGAQLAANGSARPWEKEYCRKDGSRVPVLVALALLDDGNVLSISLDLTELKRAEARKATIVDASPDAIVCIDAECRITEFNPAAVAMFGASRAAVLGRPSVDVIIPARLREVVRTRLARDMAVGEHDAFVQRREIVAQRADGAEFTAEMAIARMNGDGPVSYVGFVRDVSEQKRSEADLAERVQVATLTAEVGVALTRGDPLRETLQKCVEAVVRRLGAAFARVWTLNALEGTLELQASAGLYTHIDGPHRSVPVGKFKIGAIAATRTPHLTNDVANDPAVGDQAWARREGMVGFAGHPLIVAGELVGVMAMFSRTPLTAAVHAVLGYVADAVAVGIRQRLLADANARLEDQLRQAQKMEAIGQLAGGVAHDFNNLLSVILSYSAMLAADVRPGDPMRTELLAIHEAGTRAADLTRQLLAFGRQQILAPKVVDPFELVAGMARMLGRLLGEDVQLTTIAPAARAHVRVDPGQFEQVVMNLAVNARDAMPGGGKLTIEVSPAEIDASYASAHVGLKPGAYVLLAVSDTGTGIDHATQARIFEPFFTTKEQGKGTGLGLSTVFGIVKQSGGHVAVYSEVGRGTTFKVYLPRADRVNEAPPLRPSAVRGARGTETVLLVEDDPSVRALARIVLRKHGYVVIEAQNAGDALLTCENPDTAIDLLLTDVVMPRMGGRDLADRLVKLRPAMKVLFMSGYTDGAIVNHGVLDPGVAFLQKPLTPEALLRKVREVIDAVAPR